MKFLISLVLLTIALASSAVTARASCTNSTIKGTYAFTIHGTVFLPGGAPPLLVDGLAKTTFDGNGNLTQRLSTGTYSVNRDCTGTFTVSNGNQPPVHAQFIVAQSGNTIYAMVIDPGFATTSDAERVLAPSDED